MEATLLAPFLNVIAPDFAYESREVADAREQSWYARTPLGLLVLRYKEARELLLDRRFVFGGRHYLEVNKVTDGPLYDYFMNNLGAVGVADHARLRGFVSKAFTARRSDGMRPFIERTAARLADQIEPDQDYEFVGAFGDFLPALVICEMLGVPFEDFDLFHRYANDVGLAFSGDLAPQLERVNTAIVELTAYVSALVERRRAQPADDLISTLIRAEEDGDRVSQSELENLLLTLVWAGQETAIRQLGRALVTFAENPDQWVLLGHCPELAPQALEEVCRFSPQARILLRFAETEVEFNGLEIPAQTPVPISTVAVHRDPRAFEDPERFDVAKQRSTKQLVFGAGRYFCIGAAIARMEMASALAALATRLGPPTVTGPVVWRPPAAFIHGPEVLPLRFASRGP
jgi:cytochrome P450